MAIIGNPKKLASDVAHGYQQFSPTVLRKHSPEDLKTIIFNLNIVLKELRGRQIPPEDLEAMKDKNNQMRRLNQAINIIQIYSSSKGIKI
jgi:hypothetical protein